MATIQSYISPSPTNTARLSDAQTGSAASTNVFDYGSSHKNVLVRLTTLIGATPTCTYAIEGSVDGTTWAAVSYADSATPTVFTTSTFVITTAITTKKLISQTVPWRYLRITYSANTNVTNTADVLYHTGYHVVTA